MISLFLKILYGSINKCDRIFTTIVKYVRYASGYWIFSKTRVLLGKLSVYGSPMKIAFPIIVNKNSALYFLMFFSISRKK